MLLLFVIGAAGVGGYLYIKMKGVKPASRKNQPDPDADYSSEIRSAVLLVHGEKAHSRYFSETAYSKLTGDNKELLIIPGANHTDLYDQIDVIPFEKLKAFFEEYLK